MNTRLPALLRHPRWQRLARLGFWFFLIKGLLWLMIPAAALWFGVHQR